MIRLMNGDVLVGEAEEQYRAAIEEAQRDFITPHGRWRSEEIAAYVRGGSKRAEASLDRTRDSAEAANRSPRAVARPDSSGPQRASEGRGW